MTERLTEEELRAWLAVQEEYAPCATHAVTRRLLAERERLLAELEHERAQPGPADKQVARAARGCLGQFVDAVEHARASGVEWEWRRGVLPEPWRRVVALRGHPWHDDYDNVEATIAFLTDDRDWRAPLPHGSRPLTGVDAWTPLPRSEESVEWRRVDEIRNVSRDLLEDTRRADGWHPWVAIDGSIPGPLRHVTIATWDEDGEDAGSWWLGSARTDHLNGYHGPRLIDTRRLGPALYWCEMPPPPPLLPAGHPARRRQP